MRLTHCLIVTALVIIQAPAQKKTDYGKELNGFLEDVEKNYPFFEAKGIDDDWKKLTKDLAARAKKVKDDVEFVKLVHEAIGGLRDAHAFFTDVKPKMPPMEPTYVIPAALAPAKDGKVCVIASGGSLQSKLPKGTVIKTINGKPARSVIEENAKATWNNGGSFSSPQRVLFFEYRLPLSSKKRTDYKLEIENGKSKTQVTVTADYEAKGWEHNYNLPEKLESLGKSVHFAMLEGDVGYIYLRRMDESVPKGVADALAKMTSAKGWIFDLRGNTGGGYDDPLLESVKTIKVPVVAIIDAGCISAGETFARDLKNISKATIIGSTSAGSSTQKREYEFPSGIASVQYSIRSRFGPDGKPIEFNGITPDVAIEIDPEDVSSGRNTEIQAALDILSGKK